MELIFNEPEKFNNRNNKSVIVIVMISVLVFLIVSSSTSWKYGIVIGLFIFVIQFSKSRRWDRFFIKKIKIENSDFHISYYDEKELKTTIGKCSDFKLKKETALNKTPTFYLAIYYKNNILLKQFEIGEWTNSKMDEIVKLFNESENVSKN